MTMKIEINFTDAELLRIIDSVGSDADVIFAEGYELPSAYPPFPSQQQTFIFECQPAGGDVWGPASLCQQADTNPFDLAILEPAPTAVWYTLPKASTEGFRGLEADHSQDRELRVAA